MYRHSAAMSCPVKLFSILVKQATTLLLPLRSCSSRSITRLRASASLAAGCTHVSFAREATACCPYESQRMSVCTSNVAAGDGGELEEEGREFSESRCGGGVGLASPLRPSSSPTSSSDHSPCLCNAAAQSHSSHTMGWLLGDGPSGSETVSTASFSSSSTRTARAQPLTSPLHHPTLSTGPFTLLPLLCHLAPPPLCPALRPGSFSRARLQRSPVVALVHVE